MLARFSSLWSSYKKPLIAGTVMGGLVPSITVSLVTYFTTDLELEALYCLLLALPGAVLGGVTGVKLSDTCAKNQVTPVDQSSDQPVQVVVPSAKPEPAKDQLDSKVEYESESKQVSSEQSIERSQAVRGPRSGRRNAINPVADAEAKSLTSGSFVISSPTSPVISASFHRGEHRRGLSTVLSESRAAALESADSAAESVPQQQQVPGMCPALR